MIIEASLTTRLCKSRVVRWKSWRICENRVKRFIKIKFGRIEEDFEDHLVLRRLVKGMTSELINK